MMLMTDVGGALKGQRRSRPPIHARPLLVRRVLGKLNPPLPETAINIRKARGRKSGALWIGE